jgi:nifR3 family TIM-barrel protein
MSNFWDTLAAPFFVQAPMEDVTDVAFRTLIARKGGAHVAFTEFTSADGLVLAPEKGQQALRKKLLYSDSERPIVAQLFSAYPERMEKAAALVASLGFDGIDINMGCPDKAIEKGGCGSAMIKTPQLAREIIRAAKRGGGGLPISVKTRIGYASNEISTWVPVLLEEGIANLTIHARTRNELSDVPARWEHVAEAVALRNQRGVATRITGNGDVKDLADARVKIRESGCDGAMLGRAIYGNPWLFSEHVATPSERVEALIEHIRLFDELLGDTVNFATMKKHFKAYISGWDGSKEIRVALMDTTSAVEACTLLSNAILSV